MERLRRDRGIPSQIKGQSNDRGDVTGGRSDRGREHGQQFGRTLESRCVLTGKAVDPLKRFDHTEPRTVVFSADGEQLASSNEWNLVKIWDVASGEPAGPSFRVESNDQPIFSMAFHPTRHVLATASNDVGLWDLNTGRRLARWGDKPRTLYSVAFSQDGKMLAAGGDRQVEVWDVEQHRLVDRIRGDPTPAFAVAFASNGDHLFAAYRMAGKICRYSMPRQFTDHGLATWVAFVGDSSDRLAIASNEYRTESEGRGVFRVWNVERGQDEYVGPPGAYGARRYRQ